MQKVTIGLLLLLVLITPVTSQEAAGEGEDDIPQADRGLIPIPAVGYTPETGFILGGAAIYFSVPFESDDPLQTTNIGLNLIYGTVGFFNVGAFFNGPLLGERYYFEGDFGVSRANQEYYGIGLDNDGVEEYTQFQINIETAFLYRVTPELRIGPTVRLAYLEVLDRESDGRLEESGIEGATWTTVSGPGVRVAYDTRSSTFYPRSGVLLTTESGLSAVATGSKTTFGTTSLDGRIYHELFTNNIFAAQARLETAYGQTPFQFLPILGGQSSLRGVNEGEIRDNVTLLGQAEWRFPLFWRLSGTAFFGVGTSGDDLGGILWDRFQPAGGGGIRFALNQEQGINLRLDFAHNGRNLAVYFGFAEAF